MKQSRKLRITLFSLF